MPKLNYVLSLLEPLALECAANSAPVNKNCQAINTLVEKIKESEKLSISELEMIHKLIVGSLGVSL